MPALRLVFHFPQTANQDEERDKRTDTLCNQRRPCNTGNPHLKLDAKLQGILKLCKSVVTLTAVCELAGAALLAVRFIPKFGLGKGLFVSLFTSISAFCNAGFDLMGNYASLTGYTSDPYMLMVVATLVITGGLGFGVVLALLRVQRFSRLKLHAKLVLTGTVCLLALGMGATFLLEFDNPDTLGNMTVFDKVLNAFFQSVTWRTAGFNAIDQFALRDATKGVGVLLMLCGGAPAGTAGGLKITTIMVLGLCVRAYVKGKREVAVFGRTIKSDQIHKAITLFFVGFCYLMLMTIVIAAIEIHGAAGQMGIWNQLYEATSALCTVGVSVGVTAAASTVSRMLLCTMMYVGRVGLLTVMMALSDAGHPEAAIRYPTEDVMIG